MVVCYALDMWNIAVAISIPERILWPASAAGWELIVALRRKCLQQTDLLVEKPSPLDRALANVCVNCLVCRRARQRQRGVAFWLVQKIESRVCPFCRAYELVFGHKAHERRASTQEPPF